MKPRSRGGESASSVRGHGLEVTPDQKSNANVQHPGRPWTTDGPKGMSRYASTASLKGKQDPPLQVP